MSEHKIQTIRNDIKKYEKDHRKTDIVSNKHSLLLTSEISHSVYDSVSNRSHRISEDCKLAPPTTTSVATTALMTPRTDLCDQYNMFSETVVQPQQTIYREQDMADTSFTRTKLSCMKTNSRDLLSCDTNDTFNVPHARFESHALQSPFKKRRVMCYLSDYTTLQIPLQNPASIDLNAVKSLKPRSNHAYSSNFIEISRTRIPDQDCMLNRKPEYTLGGSMINNPACFPKFENTRNYISNSLIPSCHYKKNVGNDTALSDMHNKGMLPSFDSTMSTNNRVLESQAGGKYTIPYGLDKTTNTTNTAALWCSMDKAIDDHTLSMLKPTTAVDISTADEQSLTSSLSTAIVSNKNATFLESRILPSLSPTTDATDEVPFLEPIETATITDDDTLFVPIEPTTDDESLLEPIETSENEMLYLFGSPGTTADVATMSPIGETLDDDIMPVFQPIDTLNEENILPSWACVDAQAEIPSDDISLSPNSGEKSTDDIIISLDIIHTEFDDETLSKPLRALT